MARMVTVESLRSLLADDRFAQEFVDSLNEGLEVPAAVAEATPGEAPEATTVVPEATTTEPETAEVAPEAAHDAYDYHDDAPEVFRTRSTRGATGSWQYSPLTKYEVTSWMTRHGVGYAMASRMLGVPETTLKGWMHNEVYRHPAWVMTTRGTRAYDPGYDHEAMSWARLAHANGMTLADAAYAVGMPPKTLEKRLYGTGRSKSGAKAAPKPKAAPAVGQDVLARLEGLDRRMAALEASVDRMVEDRVEAQVDERVEARIDAYFADLAEGLTELNASKAGDTGSGGTGSGAYGNGGTDRGDDEGPAAALCLMA